MAGDGVKIATRDVDAELSLMDQVQVHPTGLFDPKQPSAGTVFLGAEALRGSGGMQAGIHHHTRSFIYSFHSWFIRFRHTGGQDGFALCERTRLPLQGH